MCTILNTRIAQRIIKCWFVAKSGPNTQMAAQLVDECCQMLASPLTQDISTPAIPDWAESRLRWLTWSSTVCHFRMNVVLQQWLKHKLRLFQPVHIPHAGENRTVLDLQLMLIGTFLCIWMPSCVFFYFFFFFSSHSCFLLLQIRGRNLHLPSETLCIFTS